MLAALLTFAAPLPPLRVEGRFLVDPKGTPQDLRGCNLGNWFILEAWMMDQVEGDKAMMDQWTLENLLMQRFGQAGRDRLMEAFRESWVTERDFKLIKSFGFRIVRLPINYRLLESDDQPYQLKANGIKWIDRAIAMAAKEGIYTILDMHGVQGGQSVYDHTGRVGQNKLWTEEENQKRLSWLWSELAKRYRSNANVAAYDVFNEPYGGTHETQVKVFDQAYRAIRKEDPDKLIFAHGHYDGFAHYGQPKERGWKNVGYQMHYYPGLFGSGMPNLRTHALHLERLNQIDQEVRQFNVPFLIGEMNVVFDRAGGAEMMRRTFDRHWKAGWMTTMWSYKVMNRDGGHGTGSWGMAANREPFRGINFKTAGLAQIERHFRAFATMPLQVNDKLRDAMTVRNPVFLPLKLDLLGRKSAPNGALEGWTNADLGGSLTGGLKDYRTKFDLFGGGTDIWFKRDEGRFLHRSAVGDFSLEVTVEDMEELETYAKAGLMVRSSLQVDSPAVIITAFINGNVQFAERANQGADMVSLSERETVGGPAGITLKIERSGERLIGSWKKNGAWVIAGEAKAPAGEVLVGPIALSHDPSQLIRVRYSGLSFKGSGRVKN